MLSFFSSTSVCRRTTAKQPLQLEYVRSILIFPFLYCCAQLVCYFFCFLHFVRRFYKVYRRICIRIPLIKSYFVRCVLLHFFCLQLFSFIFLPWQSGFSPSKARFFLSLCDGIVLYTERHITAMRTKFY